MPYLWTYWQRWPGELGTPPWIAVLSLLRAGAASTADGMLGEMLDFLAKRGVLEAEGWPRRWSWDHPILDLFAEPERWRQIAPRASSADDPKKQGDFERKVPSHHPGGPANSSRPGSVKEGGRAATDELEAQANEPMATSLKPNACGLGTAPEGWIGSRRPRRCSWRGRAKIPPARREQEMFRIHSNVPARSPFFRSR
ncbi:MAG: hypothetical protein KatS3mg115_1553 [Candidatus Poribacteria bacterium]|nr:MAG: hypothetical protein KatS3mg115_1553 [Candidatus Poribacteria bacterium]